MEPATKAELILWVDGEKVRAEVEVVTRHAQVGNGLKFLDISQNDRELLSRFLAAVDKGQVHQA